MSQTNQLVSKAIELQQNTLENSQRAMERAMEIPIEGAVDFQRNAAQLMLDGLEMGNWVSNQSVELTRNALDTYLATVENAAQDTTQLAEQGIEQAGDLGYQGLVSTQQFATGVTGNGSQVDGEGTFLAGAPQQSRQSPQDQPQADHQPRPQTGVQPQPQAGTPPRPQTGIQHQPQIDAQYQPPAAPQPPASRQQSPIAERQQPPTTGQHHQPAASFQRPPAAQQQPTPQQQPPVAPQQRPPAPQQQPPGAAQQQPPATSRQPPAGGPAPGQGAQWPADQQTQTPPAQSLPQFQGTVTARPPAAFQAQPPQPPQEAPAAQTESEATPEGQQPTQGRGVTESESNAAEAPAENA